MEEMDMRHALLAELIDNMHGRLADKMFPMPDADKADEPAAAYPKPGVSDTAEAACETAAEPVENHGDEDEPTDEELSEMMKSMK